LGNQHTAGTALVDLLSIFQRLEGGRTVAIEVEATYENGILKLDQSLPLREQQRVKVTIHEEVSRTKRCYGLLKWTGDPKDLDYLIRDPANHPWERS
jgi:predicted DNA-binding antitoxin AbrB/MazE fold protein